MLLHEPVISIVDMYVLPGERYVVIKRSLETFENADRAQELRAWTTQGLMGWSPSFLYSASGSKLVNLVEPSLQNE